MKPSSLVLQSPAACRVILLVAGVFRLLADRAIPPGLFGDEATDGLPPSTRRGHGLSFSRRISAAGLHVWIIAGMFRLMGIVPLALRSLSGTGS
jgi:hypothetical protein